MSHISAIADHFLSTRVASGPQRIAFVGIGDTIPSSFLTANLALRWAGEGTRVMVIEGKKGNTDLGDLLWKKSLPPLEEGNQDPQAVSPLPGIDLLPFCLTPDRFGCVKPSRWEKLKRQEEEADLLLMTLPGDTTLFSWASVLRSLHAVVLQTPFRERDQMACYRILRFLYLHNPFLQVYFVGILCLEEAAKTAVSDGIRFYEHLSWMVSRFLRQELNGPYLLTLEGALIHTLKDRTLPGQQFSSLNSLLERLTQKLLAKEPSINGIQFPGLFASLEAAQSIAPIACWEGTDLFRKLGDYFPLDVAVGPKRITLLLNWERRLAVGEMAIEQGVGDALVRGTEAMEWVHDHLSFLARLYSRKVDPTLSPHLVLISADYPGGFCSMVTRLDLPIILYKICTGEGGIHLIRVSPLPKPAFSPELAPDEEEALQKNNGFPPIKR